MRSAVLGVALLAVAGSASAQNCAGFIDVLAANQFCPNVEWLKNRQITLGCQIPSSYCPNDAVNRLSMAAFLNRLGTAMTPELFFVDAFPNAINIQASTENFVCQTQPYTVVDYPRTAIVHTRFAGEVDAAVTWRSDIWYSTDNGMTWDPATAAIPATTAGAAGEWTQQSGFAFVDLAVGQTYIFANRIYERSTSAGTGNFTISLCHTMLEIRNRNGTSSPFDVRRGTGIDEHAQR